MSDPASLEVTLSVTGMDVNEATALMRAMQPNARWNGTAFRPAIGGLRYAVEISGLSIAGAETMAGALAAHTRAIQEGGRDVYVAGARREERSDDTPDLGGSE